MDKKLFSELGKVSERKFLNKLTKFLDKFTFDRINFQAGKGRITKVNINKVFRKCMHTYIHMLLYCD